MTRKPHPIYIFSYAQVYSGKYIPPAKRQKKSADKDEELESITEAGRVIIGIQRCNNSTDKKLTHANLQFLSLLLDKLL